MAFKRLARDLQLAFEKLAKVEIEIILLKASFQKDCERLAKSLQVASRASLALD